MTLLLRLLTAKTFCIYLICCLSNSTINAQNTQTKFGKNRVQFKSHEWSYYETDKLDIYFYLGGQEIGKFIISEGESQLDWVEKTLNYRLDKKIQILLFNDLDDVYQTNLGLEDEAYNIGGKTKILGNKAFIHFNGDKGALLNEMRRSLLSIYINDMMFGGDIKDVVQNAVLMNLPDWFYPGLIEYYVYHWRAEDNHRLKDGILSKRYRKFMRLVEEDPAFAGQSMWYYIERQYGTEALKNILYFARINRSVESGFLYVLGRNMKEAMKDWRLFYQSNYLLTNGKKEKINPDLLVKKRFKKHKVQYNFKLGPYGRKLAYVENELGRYKVRILDIETSRQTTLLRGGYKSTAKILEYDFPLINWSSDGRQLTIVHDKKEKTYLIDYDLQEKKKTITPLEKFQKVLDFEYMGNNKNLLFSAVNRGQTDIYTMYKPTQRLQRITKDVFDDLEPTYVEGGDFKGILFISNRNNDTLNLKGNHAYNAMSYDVFYYDLLKKRETLARITETPNIREYAPMAYNQTHFSFLSDYGLGSGNRFLSQIDSVFARYDTMVVLNDSLVINPSIPIEVLEASPNDSIQSWELLKVYRQIGRNWCVSNLERGLIDQDRASKSNKHLNLINYKKRRCVYIEKIKPTLVSDMIRQPSALFKNNKQLKESQSSLIYSNYNEDSVSYKFLTDYKFKEPELEADTLPEPLEPEANVDTLSAIERLQLQYSNMDYRQSAVMPYQVQMSTEYVVSQLDNSFMFTPYEPYTGQPILGMTNMNPLVKVGTQDLFEDFKIIGGFRLPTNLSGSEYFINFKNLKYRLDKHLVYYRKSELDFQGSMPPFWYLPVISKMKTNYLEGTLAWPFSEIARIQISGAWRNTRTYTQATDTFSLNTVPLNNNWGLIRAEYVFDNTISLGLNVYDGLRFKFYTEYQQSIDQKEGNIYVFGGDIRAYKKIHRNFIFAQRLSFSKNLGTQRIIYYLGGVDGWMVPKFNYRTPVSETQQYAFQALATNMRGFPQNTRNGNTNIVYNAELRWPIVRYLNLQPSSEFLQEFQLLGFADIGTAWVGSSPFSDENPLNNESYENGPISVDVHYIRDPIVRSLGYGLRSKLFGYFVRADFAYGYEDGTWLDRSFFLSMSLDF